MPASSTRNTVTRQWELLKLIPSRGAGKTARELSEALNGLGYKVSKRQIERDLGDLQESFPLECNDASIPYGWRWVKDASANLPGVSIAEALSLRIVEDTLKPLLPKSIINVMKGRFEQASNALKAHNRHHKGSNWADKVSNVSPVFPLQPPLINEGVLETVQEALLHEQQLEVRYQSMEETASKDATLHPLGLLTQGAGTYLVATAFHYSDPRFYALHRIKTAAKLPTPARKPDGFTLRGYIASGAAQFQTEAGKRITLKAEIDESLARILAETPLSIDQKISTAKGVIKLSATVSDSWQLSWWILSQGPSIVVKRPLQLRKDITASLTVALDGYKR